MNPYKDPRTTIGGVVALAAVLGLLCHLIDVTAAVTILGLAAAWIGAASKDGNAKL